MPSIKLKGQVIEYTVRASNRAKRISLRVHGEKGVEVVYPTNMKRPKARKFLRENTDWLLKTLHKMENKKSSVHHRQYKQGETFPYMGENITLNLIKKTHGTTMTIQLTEDMLDISLPPEIELSDTDAIQYAVESFYRRQAKGYITNRTIEIADKLSFKFNRIFIKNQKTRWGSCSSNNNLNFNLRLMMASSEAIDYIIIHELCHLTHMNHSKQFWSLVGKHCPEYKHWDKWFKENSQFLVL
jgi:predicted metal-dependent hydrolase